VDQGIGRGKPQGPLDGTCAANKPIEERLSGPAGNAFGSPRLDFRANGLFESRGHADAASGQDNGDVARADPHLLDGEPPARLREMPMKAACDLIPCQRHPTQ
jgi:hypothetical protein